MAYPHDFEDHSWKDDPAAAFEKIAKGFSNTTPTATGFSASSQQSKGGSYKTDYTSSDRCYHKHPPLPLGEGLVIYGGSCWSPVVKDADIYIGLDAGMSETEKRFPWTPGHEIRFVITDTQAPKNPADFKKLVGWTAEQIRGGAKVHVGCIGGHGRTGLLLSALVSVMLPGEADAISYVRKNYCQKAVESSVQVDFLVKHFGVKPASGSKNYSSLSNTGSNVTTIPPSKFKVQHIASDTCMWGKSGAAK
jgi:protein-tyrosine phosphatase